MFWLTSFDQTLLPQYNVAFNAGPAPADPAIIALAGGGTFDLYGSGPAPQRYPFPLRYSCSIINEDADAARVELRVLKSLIGTYAKLWRTLIPGGATHWCWARLDEVNDSMSTTMHAWVIPVSLNFSRLGRWHGTEYDESTAITSSSQTVILTNSGNLPVGDAMIYVTAGGTPITYLKVAVAGVTEFYYDGTIAAGKVLTIDCASKKVRNDGANAWNDFHMTANHKVADWLVLAKAYDTSVVVTSTWGATITPPSIRFLYQHAWA